MLRLPEPESDGSAANESVADERVTPNGDWPRGVRGSAKDGRGFREPRCDYGCPVCIGIEAVGGMNPDTVDHFVSASREIVAALKSLASSTQAAVAAHDRRSSSGAPRHIDLDDGPDERPQ